VLIHITKEIIAFSPDAAPQFGVLQHLSSRFYRWSWRLSAQDRIIVRKRLRNRRVRPNRSFVWISQRGIAYVVLLFVWSRNAGDSDVHQLYEDSIDIKDEPWHFLRWLMGLPPNSNLLQP